MLLVPAGLTAALLLGAADYQPSVPGVGGGGDRVDITAPEDNALFPDVPAAVVVTVDVSNNSALEIQEVHLEVDAKDQAMICESAGVCEWTLELDEGEHELRSFVVRSIGGPLFSQFVQIQVGGDVPLGTGDDAETSTDGSTQDGTETSRGGGTGEDRAMTSDSSGDTPDSDADADESGCGCRTDSDRHYGGVMWSLLLLSGLIRRRRRAC
ncbi:MAG: hypothetical protein JKY37_07340 [Nannocystaceae bacterium]|nr:hypothetical protein [Nannocystaceae bacterium]